MTLIEAHLADLERVLATMVDLKTKNARVIAKLVADSAIAGIREQLDAGRLGHMDVGREGSR